jgi:DNA-binding CsgD family transcriptional regulator/tetratricopeptide (TPR) repeat protein
VVLHLVDCSLLAPPSTGADGQARYLMLETLRAYGLDRLTEAAEQDNAAAALAKHALQVTEQASADMRTSAGELAAARWLDAEDSTTHQTLTWALDNDPPTALRLATGLAPWWQLRGRLEAKYALLRAAAEPAAPGSGVWCAAQIWLGQAAKGFDFEASLAHYTAVRDVLAARGPSLVLADCLAGRAGTLVNLGRFIEGSAEARRALALAREIGYPAGQARALVNLSYAAYHTGDAEEAVTWARQAQQIDPAVIPGWAARLCTYILADVLTTAGEVAAAQRSCADGLALARQSGDVEQQANFVMLLADLELRAGCIPKAQAHLREALEIATRTVLDWSAMADHLDCCGHLCAATGRWAEALTLWAALAAHRHETFPDQPQDALRRQESLRKAGRALGPAQTQAAEERGAAMTPETAVEFAVMLTAPDPQAPQPRPGFVQLSARERELVTLVAQGHTDAQIADQLYISVSTVRSHLERIRDKTSCRRRADLTRLALQAGLV